MKEELFYKDFANYYDSVYSYKDYEKEVEFIQGLFKKHSLKGKDLLDVACGTGTHAALFYKRGYSVTGIDKNKEMLSIAQKKLPDVLFLQKDMKTFKLNKKFDALLCMFTAIEYNWKFTDLVKTLQNFKKHLKPQGLIIFDVPIFDEPIIHSLGFNKGINIYQIISHKNYSEIYVYWIFNNKPGVIIDKHKVKFYTLEEFKKAFKIVGLEYEIYWDFSLLEEKDGRPVFVLYRKKQ